MKIKVMHSATLADLVTINPHFKELNRLKARPYSSRYWNRKSQNTFSHDIQVIIIGKTGYGKSTTMNALLGQNIMASSSVGACTRTVQSFEFKLREHSYFSIADFPGIGESIERDAEYLTLYKNMLCKTDVILYLLRADMRDLSIDKQAIEYLFEGYSHYKSNLLFAMNFCDKIEPLDRNNIGNTPSLEQQENIALKLKDLNSQFNIGEPIIPYCAATAWNIDLVCKSLINKISKSPYVEKI